MCYVVYIATDCPDDLTLLTTDSVQFTKLTEEDGEQRPPALDLPNVWHVGSAMGCSCEFLHLSKESENVGFDSPLGWELEEEDMQEIQDATRRLYDILQAIAHRGHQVTLLDCWCGDEQEEAIALEVSLSEVGREKFKMFEGYRFRLKA